MAEHRTWQNRIVGEGVEEAGQLLANPANWRIHPSAQRDALRSVLGEVGWVQRVIVNRVTGHVVDGHLRVEEALARGEAEPVPVVYVELTPDEEAAVLATLDPIAALAATDHAKLSALHQQMTEQLPALKAAMDAAYAAAHPSKRTPAAAPVDGLTDPDAVPEEAATQIQRGDLFQLGAHRLLCGDATQRAEIARLFAGDGDADGSDPVERAVLVHADPPYGMGKDITNDNLYDDKLIAFLWGWWSACRPFLTDNASGYVWGVAETLFRFWFERLKPSERMTLGNEIIWAKGDSAMGQRSPDFRTYPTASERALFLMLGQQAFGHVNVADYWEGWDPIRLYLKGEADRLGWGPQRVNAITGVGMWGHWFTKSQWEMIPEDRYLQLQAAAEGRGFGRSYGELRQMYDGAGWSARDDFYALRAYFDNTHDAMTDVWSFPRVLGAERFGHESPKPVAMMERALLSSSPAGSIVYVPFGGTGPELIAAERLGRRARVVELEPPFCQIIINRWEAFTGQRAEWLGRVVPEGTRAIAAPDTAEQGES